MVGDTDEDCHPDMKNRLVSGQRPAGKRGMPKFWAPEREKQMETRRQIPRELLEASKGDTTNTIIDFGDIVL